MWAKVKADQVIEVFNGAKAITDSNGVQHPSSIFSNWSKDELKNIGIYPVNKATPADNRFYRGGPWGFWEVYYQDEMSGIVLQKLS